MTLNFRELPDSFDSSDESSDNEIEWNECDEEMSDSDEDVGTNSSKANEEIEQGRDDEDEVVKAIKAEKNKPCDHPPAISCEDFIVDISFNPARNLIALASIMGDVLLYEYTNESTTLVNTLELHLKACRDVEFDNEGEVMYTTAKEPILNYQRMRQFLLIGQLMSHVSIQKFVEKSVWVPWAKLFSIMRRSPQKRSLPQNRGTAELYFRNQRHIHVMDKVILATDVNTGKLKNCFENAHEEPVYCLRCLDNNKIITGDDGGTVKLWDMRKRDPVFSLKISDEYISDMITNDAQKYLVCAGGDGILTSIDLKARKIYTTSEEYDSELTCMGLFRSDTKLLVGSSKGKLYLFNWKQFGLHSDEYIGQKHSVQCMIPVTQNIVVTSGEDGCLRAAHMFPQRQLGIVGQHKLPVECLDISHDGQFLASCSHNNDVKFWNITYFESIDSIIDVNHKQNKKKDMSNNLPSSGVKNASDFFSGLV